MDAQHTILVHSSHLKPTRVPRVVSASLERPEYRRGAPQDVTHLEGPGNRAMASYDVARAIPSGTRAALCAQSPLLAGAGCGGRDLNLLYRIALRRLKHLIHLIDLIHLIQLIDLSY